MDDSGYVFNPYQWKKDNVANLRDDQIAQLDERYINIGENVFNENIENLNVTTVNISSTGKIIFYKDNTEQTTAFNPNIITEGLNNFLSSNNLWSGENKFTNLIIKDKTTTQSSQIIESGTILNIENNNNSGTIILKIRDGGGGIKNIQFDQFGNISGVNDVNCNKVKCSEIWLNSTLFQIKNDGKDNLGIINNTSNRGIKLITKTSASTIEYLFDSEGNLSIPNQIISTSMKASEFKFTENIKIYNLINNLIIDNNTPLSSFKIKNYDSFGNANTLTIDSNLNMTGINSISCNQINLPNLTHNTTSGSYVINNTYNGGNMVIQNRDETGIMKQLTIDKNINMTGINDLYVQRIFLNNSLLDFTKYNNTSTNTQMIKYNSFPLPQTNLDVNNKGFMFVPNATGGAYNFVTQSGDNLIVANNNYQSGAVLSLVAWSSQPACGIRISEYETQLNKAKVMDKLTFSDGTQQTTAMTETYLRNLITSIINSIPQTPSVPTGTILAYGANYSISPPTGYLWCMGSLVRQSDFPQLYAVIGQNFLYNTTQTPEYFYLPDLRGAYLKGVGTSGYWTNTSPVFYVGNVQQSNVGSHAHIYVDRGKGDYKIAPQDPSIVRRIADNTSGSFWTDGKSYDSNSHAQNNAENYPNSVGVGFIIKY